MREFKCLPTEDRFRNLTEEQLQLLYHHWEIDLEQAKRPKGNVANDPDYNEDEPEHFYDPDFDAEWNADDEGGEAPSNMVGEFPPETPSEPFEDAARFDGEIPTSSHKGEWEEV